MNSSVWLVTGSASGLGRKIAETVLAAGHRLVATARDPRRLKSRAALSGSNSSGLWLHCCKRLSVSTATPFF